MTAPRAPFTAPDQPIRDISTPLEVYDLGTVDYVEMWDRQAELAAQRADGLINDQLLFLEHPNTYTAGKRTQPEDRPTNGLPVVDVDRGGRITWHGPGQLVCSPIIKLRGVSTAVRASGFQAMTPAQNARSVPWAFE